MTLEDMCFQVCTALDSVGTRAVLTGGSAATVYAPHVYQSFDADFVVTLGNTSDAGKALARIGFRQKGRVYRRRGTKYTLEFPPGPLAVGNDYITDYATIRRDKELLHVLHPTDCARDRLVWFYHYRDFSALAAAIGVAESHSIDMDAICEWSKREGALEKFQFFNRQVAMAEARGSKTKALSDS